MSNPVEEATATGVTGDLATVAEVLDRASVAVGLLGTDGVVLYTNESFARACGRPAGELLGAVLANSVVADDRTELRSVLAGIRDGSASHTDGPATGAAADDPAVDERVEPAVDVRFVGADGRVRATRLNLAGLTGDLAMALTDPDDPDRSGLVMCIVTDRSEERRNERGNRRARVAEAVSAMTDPATGLLNARGIELTLESASRRAARRIGVRTGPLRCDRRPRRLPWNRWPHRRRDAGHGVRGADPSTAPTLRHRRALGRLDRRGCRGPRRRTGRGGCHLPGPLHGGGTRADRGRPGHGADARRYGRRRRVDTRPSAGSCRGGGRS
ncbi:MAG: PAS domain-containing protein [Microthrixaceae bacterium]|nr:PAS domain-containing protein [Microthrixaceae bacterium]